MYLIFNVKGQELKRTDKKKVANESVDFLKCKFYFETVHGVDEWDTLDKRALFVTDDGDIPVFLDNKNECNVPPSVLNDTNLFTMALCGVKEINDKEKTRVITNPVQVDMNWSGYTKKLISSKEPSRDAFTEVFGRLSRKFDSAELMGDYLVFTGDGHELCRVRLDVIFEESDPIFQSSPAYHIKDSDVASWNGKIDDVTLRDSDLVFSSDGREVIRVSLNNFLNSQADWSISDTGSFAYIRNKPELYNKNEIDAKLSSKQDTLVSTGNIKELHVNQEGTLKERIDLLGEGHADINLPSEQVQADWNTTVESDKSYIKSKPDLTVYAKTEEMIQAIEEAIKGITTFEYRLVDELPTPSGEKGVIYLVRQTTAHTETYDMYIWLNDDWRHIGNSAVDLSNYSTRAETAQFIYKLLQMYVKSDNFNSIIDNIREDITSLYNNDYVNYAKITGNKLFLYHDDGIVARVDLPAESDPVFKASPAGNITLDNISSWKSKYDEARLEGNQLMFYSNGELKKALTLEGIGAESDPLFKASPAYHIKDEDIVKWNKGVELDSFIDDLITEIEGR